MNKGFLIIRKGLVIGFGMLVMTLASCSTGSSLASLPDPLQPKLKPAGYSEPSESTAIYPSKPRSLLTGSASEAHDPLDLPGGFF